MAIKKVGRQRERVVSIHREFPQLQSVTSHHSHILKHIKHIRQGLRVCGACDGKIRRREPIRQPSQL